MLTDYNDSLRPDIERCIADFRESGRLIEPGYKPGEACASAYLDHLLETCAESRGKLRVAKIDENVAGYTCYYAVDGYDDHFITIAPCLYISDIYVRPEYRRRKIAVRFIADAEEYARAMNLPNLILNVFAANAAARRTYLGQSFADYEHVMVKSLSQSSLPTSE